MSDKAKKYLFITLGWVFVCVGVVGLFLPVIPTTSPLIVALILFSKSSERFYSMLLHNKHVGPRLQRWQANKSMSRSDKRKATVSIVIMFSISILVLHDRLALQIMLLSIAVVLLFFIWRIKEV